MTHSTKIRGFIFGSALFALASLTYTGSAHASSTFPAALRDALQAKFGKSYCVPLCNACHQTTLGGPANYNPFGAFLFVNGLNTSDPGLVSGALDKALAQNKDADGDGVTDAVELQNGEMPGFAGSNPLCPTDSAQYGCGARIASAPPPIDKVGLFSAGLVVLGLTLLRRRRR
ncbi:MAG: hypothetical protein ABUL62_25890 [Myxococcales bacterium]